jgi:chemotaxis protein MotA
MDKLTAGGLLLAWASLIISILMDGASLHSFVKLAPAILVFGGTFGATVIGFTMEEVKALPTKVKKTFTRRKINFEETIKIMVDLSTRSRRDGVLALEGDIETLKDDFLKKGLQLIVDGTDLEKTRDTMEVELSALKSWYKSGEEFFRQLGGFSPTLGIIGTVLGLIMMLSELEDAESMGPAIASAFIATMYGVSAANLLYLPLAIKIKNVSVEDLLEKRIILEGLLCMQAGSSPRMTEELLRSYLYPEGHKKEENNKKRGAEKV